MLQLQLAKNIGNLWNINKMENAFGKLPASLCCECGIKPYYGQNQQHYSHGERWGGVWVALYCHFLKQQESLTNNLIIQKSGEQSKCYPFLLAAARTIGAGPKSPRTWVWNPCSCQKIDFVFFTLCHNCHGGLELNPAFQPEI